MLPKELLFPEFGLWKQTVLLSSPSAWREFEKTLVPSPAWQRHQRWRLESGPRTKLRVFG